LKITALHPYYDRISFFPPSSAYESKPTHYRPAGKHYPGVAAEAKAGSRNPRPFQTMQKAAFKPPFCQANRFQVIGEGLQRCPSSMATRPHPSQTYFMAASLSLQICLTSTLDSPQKLHLDASPQGLHKWPGSFATAPQFLHVYAIVILLVFEAISKGPHQSTLACLKLRLQLEDFVSGSVYLAFDAFCHKSGLNSNRRSLPRL
jgi:hypothetical protein